MDSPYKAPRAPVDLDDSRLMESDFVKAYICLAVASVLIGALGGGLVGAGIGAIWAASGGTMGPSFIYTIYASSFTVVFIMNYFVFRFLVRKFIVQKLPTVPGHSAA